MSEEAREHDAAPAVYINLLAAYLSLVQMRDHMRFLAKVTEPRDDDNQELTFRPEDLIWCFSSLASDLDQIADAIRWSADAATSSPPSPNER